MGISRNVQQEFNVIMRDGWTVNCEIEVMWAMKFLLHELGMWSGGTLSELHKKKAGLKAQLGTSNCCNPPRHSCCWMWTPSFRCMLNKDQMEVSYGYKTRASQKAFCLLPLTLQPAKWLRICWAGKPWLSLKEDKAKEQTWREGTMTLEQKVGVLCPMQTLAKERESKQNERKGRQKEEE